MSSQIKQMAAIGVCSMFVFSTGGQSSKPGPEQKNNSLTVDVNYYKDLADKWRREAEISSKMLTIRVKSLKTNSWKK